MDKYRLDSHKLIYHVPRVNSWLKGEKIYPIYMEISPSGACNHRCIYCGLDFMEYRPRFLDTGILKERLAELGRLGLRSIMYAGEGEPFLHKDMAHIMKYTKESGIDAAVTTNGVLLEMGILNEVLDCAKWIKVSINGATPHTYAKIHRAKPEDFSKVIENMSSAAKIKKGCGYSCTLGMQMVLLPENHREATTLAKLAKDIGMDYLVIKPYSQHTQSKTKVYSSIRYEDYEYLADELAVFNTDTFNVIFRTAAMRKWDEKGLRNYKNCLALPFWSYIDAGGGVWGCSIYLGDERFFYGNINEQPFQEIWEGDKRARSLEWVSEKLDVSRCRVNCRMDDINRYLWELKHPPEHVAFI